MIYTGVDPILEMQGLLVAGKVKKLERQTKALSSLGIEASHKIMEMAQTELSKQRDRWEQWYQKNGADLPRAKEEMETLADKYEIQLLAFKAQLLGRLLVHPPDNDAGRIKHNRNKLEWHRKELKIDTEHFSPIEKKELLEIARRRIAENPDEVMKCW